ncbi:MAG: rhodanese-like domain-containing protein [Thermoguttaceae bacterium]
MISTVENIDARKTCETLNSDPQTLLVCGYERDEEFQPHHLEGAIWLYDLLSRKDSLRRDQPISFYCACPHDDAATGQARKHQKEGFTNAKVLKGGNTPGRRRAARLWRHWEGRDFQIGINAARKAGL